MVKTGGVETPKLKSYIERIERLEEEKSGLGADIRDVFGEAKSNGFDTKTMRDIIKLRKLAASIRTEQEYMLDLYKRALGMDHGMDDDEADEAAREAAGIQPDPDSQSDEELYERAKEIVVADQKASTSYVQRHLKIGYNRAAKLIEMLEANLVVGPANHVGKREVLVQRPEVA